MVNALLIWDGGIIVGDIGVTPAQRLRFTNRFP
jgi:hypothetical protein